MYFDSFRYLRCCRRFPFDLFVLVLCQGSASDSSHGSPGGRNESCLRVITLFGGVKGNSWDWWFINQFPGCFPMLKQIRAS